jgi:hypothetical protein
VTSSVADDQNEPKPSRRAWLIAHWPKSTRKRVAAVLAIIAIGAAAFVASQSLLRVLRSPQLEILGYVSLFVACWVGAGGALVPIPGVRAISWIMIVQQGAALDPLIVMFVAASAMVLGQTSYFMATRAAAARVAHSDHTDQSEVEAAELEADADEPPSRRQRLAGLMSRARDGVARQIGRHGIATVFTVCALPTPLTTLTTTAAAGSGMGYARWVVAAAAGFLLLSGVLAFTGDQLFGGFFGNLF